MLVCFEPPVFLPRCQILQQPCGVLLLSAEGTVWNSLGSPAPPVIRWPRPQCPCLSKASETHTSKRSSGDGINPLTPVTTGIPPTSWSSLAVLYLHKGIFFFLRYPYSFRKIWKVCAERFDLMGLEKPPTNSCWWDGPYDTSAVVLWSLL